MTRQDDKRQDEGGRFPFSAWGLLVVMAGVLGAACASRDTVPVTAIRVLNEDFETVVKVEDPAVLAEFSELWGEKEKRRREELLVEPAFQYKLDIRRQDQDQDKDQEPDQDQESLRWLYDPAGYAVPLSKMRGDVFWIPGVRRMNRVLRLEEGE